MSIIHPTFINEQKLHHSKEGKLLLIDFAMMGLLAFNLLLILFDALFETIFFRDALNFISPTIATTYQPVHDNFLLVDLIFVGCFLTEFLVRWGIAIVRKEYLRWYFYPFLHWYDLLGCIPLEAARIFRVLRVFSIVYRLQKYKIIDIKKLSAFKFIVFYYNVLLEELTDRIIVKALTDVQDEINEGSPILEEITQKVLLSRRETLAEWLSSLFGHIGNRMAHPEEGSAIRKHIEESVAHAIQDNKELSLIVHVPFLGRPIEEKLEQAVGDLVVQILLNITQEMSADKINPMLMADPHQADQEEQALDKEVRAIISQCLDLIKDHVAQQNWKKNFPDSKEELA
jgi:hypothetical protein